MKVAVVLFNLGGPSDMKSIKPFLFNLFNDPAIISLPQPFRYFLAWMISTLRNKKASGIYKLMGGKSPIAEESASQAAALEKALKKSGDYKVFYSHRYWHPMSKEVAKQVKEYNPDKVILLPLYPQYSTTTTASSFKDWDRSAKKAGIDKIETTAIHSYPANAGFVDANVELISSLYKKALKLGTPRLLFSAHGIPLDRIEKGDPYESQVHVSVQNILKKLPFENIDYVVCYQSKVGPLKWLEPATDEAIIEACKDGVIPVIVPIAFVSEHSETLVELDIEYKELAHENNALGYLRVPTVRTHKAFISGLAELCLSC